MSPYEFVWSDAEPPDSARLRESLAQDGFAVVRGVFPRDEIERARSIVRACLLRSGSRLGLGKTQPNASVALPELAGVFAHERIVTLVKSVLGEGNTVFTGHCDVHMNMLSGWHKDSGEAFGGYFRGDCFVAADCRVYKIGIYLQDSDRRSALRVRPGSHRHADVHAGSVLQIDTRVGDIVIFDVRLSHAGQLPDVVEKAIKAANVAFTRNDRTREDARWASALKSTYWRVMRRKDRLSVFFTYGYANAHTYDFSFFNIVRQSKQSRVRESSPPPELRDRLRAMGVAAYDPETHELWPKRDAVGRR